MAELALPATRGGSGSISKSKFESSWSTPYPTQVRCIKKHLTLTGIGYCLAATVCETDSDTRPSDLGVGLSLVFLLAKTSDEFNKMVKVRAEMETLLKEIKDHVRKNNEGHDVSKAHNLESTTSSCVTDGNENETANVHLEDQVTSSSMEVVSYEKSSQDGCCMRMDVLEEEFHAELERLRVKKPGAM